MPLLSHIVGRQGNTELEALYHVAPMALHYTVAALEEFHIRLLYRHRGAKESAFVAVALYCEWLDALVAASELGTDVAARMKAAAELTVSETLARGPGIGFTAINLVDLLSGAALLHPRVFSHQRKLPHRVSARPTVALREFHQGRRGIGSDGGGGAGGDSAGDADAGDAAPLSFSRPLIARHILCSEIQRNRNIVTLTADPEGSEGTWQLGVLAARREVDGLNESILDDVVGGTRS